MMMEMSCRGEAGTDAGINSYSVAMDKINTGDKRGNVSEVEARKKINNSD